MGGIKGMLGKLSADKNKKPEEEEEKQNSTASVPADSIKSSIDLYWIMNDISVLKMKPNILPSPSTALNKE